MISLSEHGGFPDWFRQLQFAFHVHHVETDALLAILRFVPTGYECNQSHVVYGVYIDVSLERPDPRIPPGGDFFAAESLRQTASLISARASSEQKAVLCGEAFQFEFGWQDDGRLRIEGRIGTAHWSSEYLENDFKQTPFQLDFRFKCSVSDESLKTTRTELAKLLKAIEEIESGQFPTTAPCLPPPA
jgi:hypothetical protein